MMTVCSVHLLVTILIYLLIHIHVSTRLAHTKEALEIIALAADRIIQKN